MQAALKGHLSRISAGNTKFTVSLFPENFGKIEVEVTFSEDAGLNVKMFSDNPEATKLLQQNISTLRENLACEKVSELVIDSNREKSSDGNLADDSSQSQQLVDKDAESFLSEESSEEEKVYFRSEDLFIYLEARRFRFHSQHQIWSWLREAGGDRGQFRIKGKAIKVWSVPAPEFYEEEPLGLPPTIEEEF